MINKPRNNKPPHDRKPAGGRESAPQSSARSRAPEQTFEEVRYIKRLIDEQTPVRVRLHGNQEFAGTIEYYDHSFIRLTRTDGPNLFIYKHDIKYIAE